jgi:hypothetical protein
MFARLCKDASRVFFYARNSGTPEISESSFRGCRGFIAAEPGTQ